MRDFDLYGEIIGSEDDRSAYEQVTPTQFNQFIDKLDDGEELQVSFNSVGGDLFAGIAIANTIRRISAEGHKVTAIIEGLAASIASVIMCACDKVIMSSESSFVMIHNCWTVVQGDSKTLRKEADAMDKFNAAILSFYKSKFNVPEATIKKWMDDETWFSGREAADFHFDCEVIADDEDFSIAAKLKGADLSKFTHTPKALTDIIMENTNEEKQADVVEVKAQEVKAEEEPVEVKAEEPVEEKETTVEAPESEPKAEVILPVETPEEPEKTVTLAECETRVKGMQSKMGKQLDSLRKEYDAKILDFQNQLKLKEDELMEAKASITSITAELEKAKRELQETASTLEQKTIALARLNASVLSPSVSDGDGWKKLKGKAFFEWLKNHPEAR